jgi:hypothetical protein
MKIAIVAVRSGVVFKALRGFLELDTKTISQPEYGRSIRKGHPFNIISQFIKTTSGFKFSNATMQFITLFAGLLASAILSLAAPAQTSSNEVVVSAEALANATTLAEAMGCPTGYEVCGVRNTSLSFPSDS